LAHGCCGAGHVEAEAAAGSVASDVSVKPTAAAIDTSRRNRVLCATSVSEARLVPQALGRPDSLWCLIASELDAGREIPREPANCFAANSSRDS